MNSLWQIPSQDPLKAFHLAEYDSIPDLGKAYLSHAITEGAPLAQAVRLQMQGEIKLKNWLPFTATQVVRADGAFVWSAEVKQGLFAIKGFDQFVDGLGEMQWKLFGIFPVMTGSGPDVSRSAGDRSSIERILMPSAFCRPEVRWTCESDHCTLTTSGVAPITLDLAPSGRVVSVSMLRWGNPEGGAFGQFPFGGYADEERTFEGYTIPSRLRIGWHFGTDRFEEGEFFRAEVTAFEFK